MGKIAVGLQQALAYRRAQGIAGRATPRVIARGEGWSVADVVCTSGPQDRPFEEQHAQVDIALVLAGTFQYRSSSGRGMMTPGSIMLGNPGQCFECGHEHGEGDRCVSFWYEPGLFARLTMDAGGARADAGFDVARLPPLRATSPAIARAASGLLDPQHAPWEEIAIEVAVQTMSAASGVSLDRGRAVPNAEARVTRIVRLIDRHPGSALTLGGLARAAGLSPYHFLRTFERVTGVTPHQYILRARLREAALRLADRRDKVVDVALDCGFSDLSNFNRAFRLEFGVSPRVYQQRAR